MYSKENQDIAIYRVTITEVANLLASVTLSTNCKASSSGAGNGSNFLPEQYLQDGKHSKLTHQFLA